MFAEAGMTVRDHLKTLETSDLIKNIPVPINV